MVAFRIVSLFCLIVAIATQYAIPNSVHDPHLKEIASLVANTMEYAPDCPFESSCACMRFSEELVRNRKSSIMFLHIHKGAGTTMCTMAKANKKRVPVRKGKSFATFLGLNCNPDYLDRNDALFYTDPSQAVRYVRSNKIDFYADEYMLPRSLPPLTLGTLLRNPVDRVLSEVMYTFGDEIVSNAKPVAGDEILYFMTGASTESEVDQLRHGNADFLLTKRFDIRKLSEPKGAQKYYQPIVNYQIRALCGCLLSDNNLCPVYSTTYNQTGEFESFLSKFRTYGPNGTDTFFSFPVTEDHLHCAIHRLKNSFSFAIPLEYLKDGGLVLARRLGWKENNFGNYRSGSNRVKETMPIDQEILKLAKVAHSLDFRLYEEGKIMFKKQLAIIQEGIKSGRPPSEDPC